MGALRLIFGLFIAVLIVSFGVLNMELISVKYHRIGTLQLPIFYFLVIFFSAGFLVAWVGGLLDRIRFFTRIRGYRKEVKNLRRELEVAQNKNGRLLATSSSTTNGESSRQLISPVATPESESTSTTPRPDSQKQEGRNVSVD
ncbi:MAG: LapA family protein [Nitrospinaceae bacterium]|jgi:uncharacterized integral membrane protein|nr:LapA family protein [Nitrospinaceae bacterium]MBT3433169.1 LapA family protein [Nitrospinaceae bacterium]MBT3823045.1 LapA family protein [Nitrospinaceae bacterium]MBT4095636.1 LapA family protein [Nitrospinaceae bacterium]MBT4432271.1 LapA family protein [Nitrospinaceae bacterium]